MNFSANLRRLRNERNLSQEALAHACGFSGQSRIGNYEGGTREPNLHEIELLAKALNVSIGELFGEGHTDVSESHETGLDPVILGETAAAIDRLYERANLVFKVHEDPERFLQAYAARLALPEKLSSADMLDFSLTLAAIYADRTNGGGDGGTGRSKDLPAGGSAGGNVARRRRG